MFWIIREKICVKDFILFGCLLFSICSPFSILVANQAESFSAIDGLTAFQSRASGNQNLAPIYSKWQRAVQFYVGAGVNRLPNSLIVDLRSAGVTVENSLSQQQIDQTFSAPSSNEGVAQQSEGATSSTPSLPSSSTDIEVSDQVNPSDLNNENSNQSESDLSEAASNLSSGGSDVSVDESSTNSSGNSSGTNSSSASNGGGTSGSSNSASNGSNPAAVENSNLLGDNNNRTSYLVSSQFGRIIQALGGNSAGNLNRSAARGYVNSNGAKPPSLYSNEPTNNGGSSGSSTTDSGGGSGSSATGGSSEDSTGSSNSDVSGGGGSDSDGGSSGGTTSSGTSGGTSSGDTVLGGYDASTNFSCTAGADGDQCVIYARNQFIGHPGHSGLVPLCGANPGQPDDCGAKFAYLNDLWDMGFGKGITPRNNSVAVWESNSGFGHMAVVYQVTENQDGTYNILVNDSNWTGDETQMCAIPYEVNTSTMETFRDGHPTPKTLIGFIYGEAPNSGADGGGSTSGGSFIAGGTGYTGGTGTQGFSDGDSATGGESNGTTDDGGGITNQPVTLGMSISSIVFHEYGANQNSLTNSQVIGTDISESDFLQANQQANSSLVSFYNGIKDDSDFKSIAELALAINPSQAFPAMVLADDNQINGGSGIIPQYNPNTNQIILGNTAFSEETLTEMKITAIHELAHSQQKIRVFESEQLYGPDGQHYATEVTSLSGAYVEGYAEFWQAYYEPAQWAKFQFGMSLCGFRKEDSSSTAQNPHYNGLVGAPLNCEDMIPWTSLSKEDFFKVEGIIASILLEVALRIPEGLTKVIQAMALENNIDTTSLDLLEMLGQVLSGEDNARYLLILDVMTNFKYSLEELKQISGTTSLTIDGFTYDQQMAVLGGLTGRELVIQEARKTVDHNDFTVRYNGFHALDQVDTALGNQVLLPRIDSRALSRGSIKASEPDSNGELFYTATEETAFAEIENQVKIDNSTKIVHDGY